jgi:RNA polymerase sigma factor (sigma-70 family)
MSMFETEMVGLLPRLRRFAHSLSHNASDADDLTQKVIERALRSESQWQAGTRLDAWLFRIMRNLWIDTVRARGRVDKWTAPEEAGLSVGVDPRPALEARLTLDQAMAAMEQLPDEQREVGFGYREAADMLEIPIGTLSSRLLRGRKNLLALLGEQTEEERTHDH